MNILRVGSPYLDKSLTRFGHKIFGADFTGRYDLKLAYPVHLNKLWDDIKSTGFMPDLFLYLDDGNLPVIIDPYNSPCPAVYYSIDTYCNPWHVAYANGFDLILVAQKDFLSLFSDENLDAHWFPLFYYDEFDRSCLDNKRDIDTSFVGTLGHKNNPDRAPFLKEFNSYQPLQMLQGEYKEIFANSRIVLNQTAFSEINFRCFEVMACGAALLTENCANGMDELFIPGEHILPPYTRNDAKMASMIARRFLARPELLKEIAKNGFEYAAQYHSAMARAKTLLDLWQSKISLINKKQKINPLRSQAVHTAFTMIGVELNTPQMSYFKKLYLELGNEK